MSTNRFGKYRKIRRDMFIHYKETLQCCICGESCPDCLDFHHIDKDSKSQLLKNLKISIGVLVIKVGNKKIIEELNKCICVCSNCHRKIHAGVIVLNQMDIDRYKINLPLDFFDIKEPSYKHMTIAELDAPFKPKYIYI